LQAQKRKEMYKKIFLSLGLILGIALFANQKMLATTITDSTTTEQYTPFYWDVISDVDKVLQHEKMKDLNKRAIDQSKIGSEHYETAVKKMQNKDYLVAIAEFKNAMKRYKRAKLGPDAYNYLHTNMALCYVSSGKTKDKVMAKRYVNLLTKTIFKEEKWLYNIAIVQYHLNNQDEAASMLSSCIKMDEFNYQAYTTLKALYEESGNTKSANKVHEQMQSAQAKRLKEKQRANADKKRGETKKKGKVVIAASSGIEPDINNLKIVTNDDHLQFNKINEIDERSMAQIQQGVGAYNDGIKALKDKQYSKAIDDLKEAEKRLKRGKITEDGLNFVRGNLAIAYLSKGDKRGLGQAKRYLKYLTKQIYKTRDWTYNLGVAYYTFGDKEKALDLFKLATKQDRLYLTPYQNMIYVYTEMDEGKKALSVQKSYEKNRDDLIKSFSRQDQSRYNVTDPYLFRVNLGTYGEFDTPEDLFDESNLISVPLNNSTTTYLAGIFYNMNDATDYQKQMRKKGYSDCFIVAFKDGEKLEF
jgi:tetratricopeptide (TPR) repeat protein|tara:strand:+ start:4829 stop:6412 length:1584 start_codon:yes stop_codon:yes gene_type:complete